MIQNKMIKKMASSSNVEEIIKSLKAVTENIQKAIERRPPNVPKVNPRLVAVSKTKSIKDIITVYKQGQRHFGENYVQELREKAQDSLILENCKDIRWHYIGHMQGNKSNTVVVLPNLYMVETIHSSKLAQQLNKNWEKFKRPGKLCVMVQVNTSGENNKSGCKPEDVSDLVTFIKTQCPCLTFSGLMTIGAWGHDPSTGPNQDFLKLVQCRENLCKELDLSICDVELSMGMSGDYEHAIELGSSNVRVGSTIFGARDKPPSAVAPATSSESQAPPPTTSENQTTSSTTSVNQLKSDSAQPSSGSQTNDNISNIQEGVEQVNINDDRLK